MTRRIAAADLAVLIEQLLRDLGPQSHTELHARLERYDVHARDIDKALRLLSKNVDGNYPPRPETPDA